MKKITAMILVFIMLLALCVSASAENRHFDRLTLVFAPSLDADVIFAQTEGLPELIKAEMSRYGFDIGEVDITVGESYDRTGEALASGAADVGWLPDGTYAAFSEKAEVLLTATRADLSNDSEDPAD